MKRTGDAARLGSGSLARRLRRLEQESAADQQVQQQADYYAIDQIEKTWHKAASTQNVDLMMTLWAPDATFNIGTETLTGKAQIRTFFADGRTIPARQPLGVGHAGVQDPDHRERRQGNALLRVPLRRRRRRAKVVSVVGADQTVQKIDGKWLITSSAAATPTLG